MFRLDNVLEKWAEVYEPLKHDPAAKAKHKTFFRISMIDGQSYFIRNHNTQPSPCMAFATHVDAESEKNSKFITYRHVIYFMQKQPAGTIEKTQITDELGATEARFTTDDMAQDFIALIDTMQSVANGKSIPASVLGNDAAEIKDFIEQTARDPEYTQGLRGLHIDEAHWGTLPPMFNGWQICGLTIEQTVPRRLCINPERYV